MNKETEERLSIIVLGIAMGLILSSFLQILGAPSWIQLFGSLFVVALSYVLVFHSNRKENN